jgi:hypothetical protein
MRDAGRAMASRWRGAHTSRLVATLVTAAAMASCGASAPGAVATGSGPAAATTSADMPPDTNSAPAEAPSSTILPTPSPEPAAGSALPAPSFAPAPPRPTPSTPVGRSPASTARFSIDLFRRGDFVSEARTDWCVPAAIQMMALMDHVPGSRLPSQATLNLRARALSSSRLVGAGSEPRGWAGVLDQLGIGPYRVVAEGTLAHAVAAAASALRRTRRPVGLVVWRGAHAWVVSGFTSTADPARGSFRVTGVRISDPWYPRTSSSFGRPHGPDTLVSLADLARNFLPYHRAVRYPGLDGRYLLVLPETTAGA